MDTNIKHPIVSVLMPVFNCELYVASAIESILNQSFKDFEFIIIDDFSTDKSLKKINYYKDKRIKVLKKTRNSGISDSLNLGLKNAKGKYIIRMDADDVSLYNRIEKQVEFLDKNLDYVLCGSNFRILDTNVSRVLPESSDAIKVSFLRSCAICHPTVAFRKEILDNSNLFYDNDMEPAEDYNLWTKLIQKSKFYNIQEELLLYRIHKNQITKKNSWTQHEKSFQIKLNFMRLILKDIDQKEIDILRKVLLTKEKIQLNELLIFSKLCSNLEKGNEKEKQFEEFNFRLFLNGLKNKFLIIFFTKEERYSILDYYKYLRIKQKYGLKLYSQSNFYLFVKSILFYKK